MKVFSYLTAVYLAFGLTLTTATQLRLSGLPVGAGEVLLVSWLFLIPFEIVRRRYIAITAVTKWIGTFWYLSFTCLFVGFWIALQEGLWDSTGFHDITAYLFIAVLFITLSMIHPFALYMQVVAQWFLSFSFAFLVSMYIGSQWTSSLGPLSFWYWDRFTGWATNPNQLALHITVATWIGGYYFLTATRFLRKCGYFILILGLSLVGWATKSDSLLISSMTSLVFYVTIRFILGSSPARIDKKVKSVTRSMRYLLVLLFISITIIVLYQPLLNQIETIYNDGHQGSLRFLLWENGLVAIAASPFFGLGPGAHSGREGPFQGFEAHNTLIDWGGSAGILGILVLVGLYTRCGYICWKTRQYYLFTSLLMIFQFSFFHYVLRQPIYWFMMTWLISAALIKQTESSSIMKF